MNIQEDEINIEDTNASPNELENNLMYMEIKEEKEEKEESVVNKGEENNNTELEDNENEEFNCEEFKGYSKDGWKKYYPENDRFFKFPKEGIIHNKIIKSENEIYKGDINMNGEKNGFGKFISPEVKRIGFWRKDSFNGWGREIIAKTGEIYEGRFVNGKLNGIGILKNIKNTKEHFYIYIGDFVDNKKQGKGELFNNRHHYKGDFYDNKMNGKGKIEIYNQGEYEGTFKDDQIEGRGTLKWKDGSYYKGEVSKGKMNGYGEEMTNDGKIFKGIFVNGEKQKEISSEKKS